MTPSSAAAPSPTRASARPSARPWPTSAPGATPPSAPRTQRSVAGARTVVSSSTPTTSSPPATRSSTRIRRALDQAIDHVRRFAETQRPTSTTTVIAPGIEIERRWTPIASVGAYVPGGSAAYPSSLVMTVVPAQVAGVERIVVASPAGRDGAARPGPPRRGGPARRRCLHRRRWRPGDRRPGLRPARRRHRTRRPDRRPGQRLGHRGQDRGLRRGRHRPPGRPVGGDGPRRATRRPDPRRGRPHHPGRARPGLTGDPRHDRRRLRRRGRGRRRGPARARRASRHPRGRPARPRPDRPRADLDAAIAFVNAYAPEHLSVDVEPLEPTVARLRNAGSVFVGPWAPESAGDYATGANHVLPTGGLARASGALAVETLRQVQPDPAHRPRRARLHPRDHRDARRGGGPARPSRRRRDPLRGAGPMSPTPVTFTSPTAPASYRWEATDEQVAARYGVDPATIVRFDLNTSPTPPALVNGLLAAGRFEAPLSEYPPTDYRRLIEAAAARYGVAPTELLVAPAPTRSSTSSPRSSSPAAGSAIVPTPTYAMYRVVTEQRGGTVVAVPRLGEADGFALDGPAIRAAVATRAPRSSGCAARTTRPRSPSPTAAIATLLDGLTERRRRGRTPGPDRRPRRGLRRVRRDVAGRTPRRLSEPHHGPDREQGLRPGRAAGRLRDRPPRDDRPAQPVPAARLGLDRLGHDRHRGAARSHRSSTPTSTASSRERARLTEALRAIGWSVGPSVTNFILVDFGIAGARRRGRRGPPVDAASSRARSAPAIRSPTTSA